MAFVNSRAGLRWKENLWGDLEPEWTIEPNINIIAQIARRELRIPEEVACEVNFLASGAFNKVYTIQVGDDTCIQHIMRVSLPISPRPRFGHLISTKDLQQLATADLADAKLFGSEYSTDTQGFCQGRIISMPFFWGKHLSCNVSRGTFTNSRDWSAAQLQLHLIDLDEEPSPDTDSDSDDDFEDLYNTDEAVKRRAARLMAVLAKVFPEDEAEEFVLHHYDLNQGNILLDLDDNLSGIIDWECVHTAPLYLACQKPKFLDAAMDRSVCPDPANYAHGTLDDGTVEMNEMYYRHLEEYENQCLWGLFLQEMGRQCPEWITWHKLGKLKSGLDDCVASFGTAFGSRDIDEWLDNVEKKGNSRSLQEIRRVCQHYLDDPDGYRSPPDSDAECVADKGSDSDHESAWETASDSSSRSTIVPVSPKSLF